MLEKVFVIWFATLFDVCTFDYKKYLSGLACFYIDVHEQERLCYKIAIKNIHLN